MNTFSEGLTKQSVRSSKDKQGKLDKIKRAYNYTKPKPPPDFTKIQIKKNTKRKNKVFIIHRT